MYSDNFNTKQLDYIKKMQEIYLFGGDLLSDYCPETGFSIYIDGALGYNFLNYFLYNNKPMNFIISDNTRMIPVTPLFPRRILTISSRQADLVPETDVIIISSVHRDHEIYDRVSSLTKAKIVFLTDLISDNYLKSIFINPASEIFALKPAKIFFCNYPQLDHITNKSDHEAMLLKAGIALGRFKKAIDHPEHVDPVFKPHGFGNDYIECVIDIKENNKYFTAENGMRITVDKPENPVGNIYLLGNSLIYGQGADDKNTIGSSLQRYINEWAVSSNKYYSVFNFSCVSGYCTKGIIDIIKQLALTENDIVICFYPFSEDIKSYMRSNYLFCDPQPVFNRPHDMGEVFYDVVHLNFIGYNAIAKNLFNCLLEKNAFNTCDAGKKDENISNETKLDKTSFKNNKRLQTLSATFNVNKELLTYQNMLKSVAKSDANIIGAIVMNCNPFTLGHRYLINMASKQVDHLYVFVVEEDKSYFKFKDRFELVKLGTKDIDNVTVIPSGKFIISALTFADYFDKEGISDKNPLYKTIDASLDVAVFAEKIAPILNITKRFVGEEPFCKVTRQYNEEMRSILPTYDIDVIVIPRIEIDDEPISASRVRMLLDANDFEGISKIVPSATLEYLTTIFKTKKSEDDSIKYNHISIDDLKLIEKFDILFESKIVIYGSGQHGKKTYKKLKIAGIPILFFCNSNMEYCGVQIDGIEIISPQKLAWIDKSEKIIIIIATDKIDFIEQILDTLADLKLRTRNIFTMVGLDILLLRNINGVKINERWRNSYLKTQSNISKLRVCANRLMMYGSWLDSCINGYDNILVYQSGKVGSDTVCKSLAAVGVANSHIHSLNVLPTIKNTDTLNNIAQESINTLLSRKKIKIITLVSEPVSRAISMLMYRLYYNPSVCLNRENFSVYSYIESGIQEEMNFTFNWFDNELKAKFGIDVFEYPFDKEKGYSIIKQYNISILLIKLEKLNNLTSVIGEFVGAPNFKLLRSNVSDEKPYKYLYNNIKSTLKISRQLINSVYIGNFKMDHFYSENEKIQFVNNFENNITD